MSSVLIRRCRGTGSRGDGACWTGGDFGSPSLRTCWPSAPSTATRRPHGGVEYARREVMGRSHRQPVNGMTARDALGGGLVRIRLPSTRGWGSPRAGPAGLPPRAQGMNARLVHARQGTAKDQSAAAYAIRWDAPDGHRPGPERLRQSIAGRPTAGLSIFLRRTRSPLGWPRRSMINGNRATNEQPRGTRQSNQRKLHLIMEKPQVKWGGPPGTRTQNQRIKSSEQSVLDRPPESTDLGIPGVMDVGGHPRTSKDCNPDCNREVGHRSVS
jgi:hypothetical protein